MQSMRIGTGYDIHRTEVGRRLVLGGVVIPWDRGLVGHSDADVVLHAICDALLGAAGLGDIGELFPDSDPQHKDAASARFVTAVVQRVRAVGYAPVNVDVTILAEQPRLSTYKSAIRESVAGLCGLAASAVGIKAATNEGLDSIGRGEAIACQVVVLLAARPAS